MGLNPTRLATLQAKEIMSNSQAPADANRFQAGYILIPHLLDLITPAGSIPSLGDSNLSAEIEAIQPCSRAEQVANYTWPPFAALR